MPLTIDDLPNELLDEIFSYVVPLIRNNPIIPVQTVCRRWNRPFMTEILSNSLIPANIDLQTKFPKLTTFRFFTKGKYCHDLSFFKGHAFLKELAIFDTGLTSSALNCPRLTSLALRIDPKLFFNDDNLGIFLVLLPSLERLKIDVDSKFNSEHIQSCNQQLATILQKRPKCQQLKLKWLALESNLVDFISFCAMFQTPSLDHFETGTDLTAGQVRKLVGLFPKSRSFRFVLESRLSFTDIALEHVTSLKIYAKKSLSFSSLMKSFPKVESLEVASSPIIFDLKVPTRLTHLSMKHIGTIQPILFGHLNSLDWTINPDSFNYVLQELGKHCPQLNRINMEFDSDRDNWMEPELDGIEFPLLITLRLAEAYVMLNASFLRFLARHGRLKSLECRRNVAFEHYWRPIESDQALWPHLRYLVLDRIHNHHDYTRYILPWLLKNAPNAKNPCL